MQIFKGLKAATGGVLYQKVLKISQNSQENTYTRVFFNKVAGLRPVTLLKQRLCHRCFPVNLVKFLRTPFLRTPPVAASEGSQVNQKQTSKI